MRMVSQPISWTCKLNFEGMLFYFLRTAKNKGNLFVNATMAVEVHAIRHNARKKLENDD